MNEQLVRDAIDALARERFEAFAHKSRTWETETESCRESWRKGSEAGARAVLDVIARHCDALIITNAAAAADPYAARMLGRRAALRALADELRAPEPRVADGMS